MEKKIIFWNINQRNNSGNHDRIPELVASSIGDECDIIILSEFYKTTHWIKELGGELPKHNVFVSDNPTNQILIAVKKDMNVKEVSTWKSSYTDNKPDYLSVTIEVINEKKTFDLTIVGARILVDKYDYKIAYSVNNEMKNRKKQCDFLSNEIKRLQKKGSLIIGGGDFNTGRRDNKNEYWSMGEVRSLLGEKIILDTPKDGHSHVSYGGNLCCPDHMIYSNSAIIKVDTQPYNWEFVKKKPDIYTNGKETENISNPFPDHAMLEAEFKI